MTPTTDSVAAEEQVPIPLETAAVAPAVEQPSVVVSPATAAPPEDFIVKFLTSVLGDEKLATTAKAQIMAAAANPALRSAAISALRRDAAGAEHFGPDEEDDGDEGDGEFIASSANDEEGTIDCVWYGGATVPRMDQQTGKPYMLKLAMDGCRMGRLNAGAPIFDNHFTGDDFKSILANIVSGKVGTKAQVGVVQKAWSADDKGMATLQFDLGTQDGAELYRKTKTGIIRNLSFGAWIYKKEQDSNDQVTASQKASADDGSDDEMGMFTATDWEPFEISPVTIPADFTTQFLSAQGLKPQSIAARATSPEGVPPVEPNTTQVAGEGARLDQTNLDAVRAETVALERKRVSDIRAMGVTHNLEALAATLIDRGTNVEDARGRFTAATEISNRATKFRGQLGEEWISTFINEGRTADEFSVAALERLSVKGQQDVTGRDAPISGEVSITRDQRDTSREQLESALIMRHNPKFFSDWAKSVDPNSQHNAALGTGDQIKYEQLMAAQRELPAKGREYIGLSLLDMGRLCLRAAGVNVNSLRKDEIAERCLKGSINRLTDYSGYVTDVFAGEMAQGSSDFPSILANVANKTLRQGYEAAPRTFQVFCKQVTAQDFKPVNRVQLSDSPVLAPLNEQGEYTRALMKDSNQNYSLGTFGKIVALTRKVIINDDMQAFTRVPMALGVAGARLESDKVWAVITGNQTMAEDGTACFTSGHGNLFTGAGSALALGAAIPPTGITQGRAKMRQQKGPQGTILNLVPRFIAVPTVLETPALQMIAPLNIASSDSTKVVPDWVRSLVPIVEPRLDADSTTAWYMFADPADIDTIEFCYLEGQQGMYLETRQPWESDGVEIKARLDFAAAAIDYRGLQKNSGV